ncbi:hypothetical protein KIL84_005435 [Mauremys mutica]|uniref:Uncharacterized protein n=1 Tax=Mauremys mutica TaxID=74926 RepID=A0A9D4B648_9SAUR|nr:hypothetical protein KIL84_005435 [Mauremys mutica]
MASLGTVQEASPGRLFHGQGSPLLTWARGQGLGNSDALRQFLCPAPTHCAQLSCLARSVPCLLPGSSKTLQAPCISCTNLTPGFFGRLLFCLGNPLPNRLPGRSLTSGPPRLAPAEKLLQASKHVPFP